MSELHATPRRGAFSAWTEPQARAFADSAQNTIAQFWTGTTDGLIGAICTVDKDGYDRACQALPWLAAEKPLAAVCADSVLVTADATAAHHGEDLELYFDRGEPFRKHIQHPWDRATTQTPGLLGRIVSIHTVDGAEPPMQAADFLAWHAMRSIAATEVGQRQLHQFTLLTTAVRRVIYDYDAIMKRYKDLDHD